MTTATAAKTKIRASRSTADSRADLPPSLGELVCRWIERYLVHGEGDYLGQPFRLRRWQRALIYRAYELNPDGSRRYSRVLWGFPKGNGKTEVAAAVALAELAGPVCFAGWDARGRPRGRARMSPDIPLAAASFEQAALIFGAARNMVRAGPLMAFCEVFDTKILLKGRPGQLYRVAAIAGSNDGKRPTFFVGDELHEWTGNKERVYLVLSNGRAKRKDAWELSISTAGWDGQSLLGKNYAHGKRVQAGEEQDAGFLMEWFEASDKHNLNDPAELVAAIREANPAVGDFLPLANVIQRFREIPEFEFRRYHLNQWVSSPERWLPFGCWDSLAKPRAIAPGTAIMVGFDGSYAGDSTAIVGATIEPIPHLFTIKAWEKPASAAADWRVDVLDVEAELLRICGHYDVRLVGCDPFRWQRSLEVLKEAGIPVIEWPSHQASHMVPACASFYEAATNAQLTHNGEQAFAQHITNCVVKIDSRGPRITKDHKDSPRRIDIAVAGVIAHDLVVRERNAGSGFAFVGFNTHTETER
jgi:phage terminase large subunit-like protein